MATIGVFAAIFDTAGRILCVHQRYAGECWTNPGGRVEPGEAVDAALVREVREETGLRVRVGHLIGVYAKPYSDDIVLFFAATEVGRDGWTPDDEIGEWNYFAPDALPQPMRQTTAVRIADAFAERRGVVRVFAAVDAVSYEVGGGDGSAG